MMIAVATEDVEHVAEQSSGVSRPGALDADPLRSSVRRIRRYQREIGVRPVDGFRIQRLDQRAATLHVLGIVVDTTQAH